MFVAAPVAWDPTVSEPGTRMPKVTSHERRAEATTPLSPDEVFAVAGDLTTLLRWQFPADSAVDGAGPGAGGPERRLEEVDGGGTTAAPGVAVDVHTEAFEGTVGGRKVRVEEPARRRFVCATVEPGRRLVLAHELEGSGTREREVRTVETELTIAPEDDGSRVVLAQRTEVIGRGLAVRVARRAHDRADGVAARSLAILLEDAEERAAG